MNNGERTTLAEITGTLDELTLFIAQGEATLRRHEDVPHTLDTEVLRQHVTAVLANMRQCRDALLVAVQAYAALN